MLIIVDYNNNKNGKLGSALSSIQAEYKYSDNEYEICKADKLILPGYGIASTGIKKIHILNLFTILRILKKPLLGIGLGMEILCDYSPEGNVSCLGILGEKIQKFEDPGNEIPFHGMHQIEIRKEGNLLKDVKDCSDFYFDNSYYLPVSEYSTAVSKNNATEFSAAVEKGNFYGVQFHPEDSGENGLKVLDNFIHL
jgi:glutamine amidotransferase